MKKRRKREKIIVDWAGQKDFLLSFYFEVLTWIFFNSLIDEKSIYELRKKKKDYGVFNRIVKNLIDSMM